MLVGIISDTHDRLDCARAAVELFASRKAAAVVHAGDMVAPFTAKIFVSSGIPLHAVLGNNDGERTGLGKLVPGISEAPLEVEIGGRRFVVVHDLKRLRPAAAARAEVVVHGHTHEAELRRDGAAVVINPGEACGWLTGRPTAALLETKDLSVEILDLRP